ncbi:MAG: radical SAM protein [Nitrososphaerota archaeon]|nr:radical SAM protein [Nitrososphaerota archaeon]
MVAAESGTGIPLGVASGTYTIRPPLIKPSKLTCVEKGGVGRQLSDGWALNFAIGCNFGCKFCYVDQIHKRSGRSRAGDIVNRDWGYYFAIPSNLEEAIRQTDWKRWKDEEVMISSMHDPYLPQLFKWTRVILEKALPEGVRFCVQTRSPLVERDFGLLSKYKEQLRVQVSIATMGSELSRLTEPRVVPPQRRVEVIRKARESGLDVGVIIAPVFPPVRLRQDVPGDLKAIAAALEEIRPEHIYGESLHARGSNLKYIEKALGERVLLKGFDERAEKCFHCALPSGTWWPER